MDRKTNSQISNKKPVFPLFPPTFHSQPCNTLVIREDSSWYDATGKNPEGLRILLVEDTPLIQKIHANFLHNLGYAVDIAATGSEAIELFNQHQYHAILLDIGLPDINGIDVCKHLMVIQQEKNTVTPILALTTQVDKKTQKQCLAAGMVGVLPKPIRSSQLKEVLDKYRSKSLV